MILFSNGKFFNYKVKLHNNAFELWKMIIIPDHQLGRDRSWPADSQGDPETDRAGILPLECLCLTLYLCLEKEICATDMETVFSVTLLL